jgi:hypothetical protein
MRWSALQRRAALGIGLATVGCLLALQASFAIAFGTPEWAAAGVRDAASASPTPAPALPTPRPIYKGFTIAEIAANPELLKEVLSQMDYSRPGGVRVGPDGSVIPPLPDGDSDLACPNGEECP